MTLKKQKEPFGWQQNDVLPDQIKRLSKNTKLFVYGYLKPHFPGYDLIRAFDGKPVESFVYGSLSVRDGMPFLVINDSSGTKVKGFTITFKHEDWEKALCTIQTYEPKTHYGWMELTCPENPLDKVIGLVGKSMDKGCHPINPKNDVYNWTLEDDACLTEGLSVVKSALEDINNESVPSLKTFFNIQAYYLLLWSIIERLAGLSVPDRYKVVQKIDAFSELPAVKKVLSELSVEPDSVFSAKDLEKKNKNTDRMAYYYQLRSNITHSGKSLDDDHKRLKTALNELYAFTEKYVQTIFLAEEEK